MNRFAWDMRHDGPRDAPGDDEARLIAGPSPSGPSVVPGAYTVRLEAAGRTLTRELKIVKDPRSEASDAGLDEQLALLLRLRDRISETNDAINETASCEAAGAGMDRPCRCGPRRGRGCDGGELDNREAGRHREQAGRETGRRPSGASLGRRFRSWPRRSPPWSAWWRAPTRPPRRTPTRSSTTCRGA